MVTGCAGFKDKKENQELLESWIYSVAKVTKRKLRWFGHVERTRRKMKKNGKRSVGAIWHRTSQSLNRTW
jgi:hypothetical protein